MALPFLQNPNLLLNNALSFANIDLARTALPARHPVPALSHPALSPVAPARSILEGLSHFGEDLASSSTVDLPGLIKPSLDIIVQL